MNIFAEHYTIVHFYAIKRYFILLLPHLKYKALTKVKRLTNADGTIADSYRIVNTGPPRDQLRDSQASESR